MTLRTLWIVRRGFFDELVVSDDDRRQAMDAYDMHIENAQACPNAVYKPDITLSRITAESDDPVADFHAKKLSGKVVSRITWSFSTDRMRHLPVFEKEFRSSA